MQLTYRGVTYNYKSERISLPSSSYTGVYRGRVFNTSSVIRVMGKFAPTLKYRGVDYRDDKNFNSTKTLENSFSTESFIDFFA